MSIYDKFTKYFIIPLLHLNTYQDPTTVTPSNPWEIGTLNNPGRPQV